MLQHCLTQVWHYRNEFLTAIATTSTTTTTTTTATTFDISAKKLWYIIQQKEH